MELTVTFVLKSFGIGILVFLSALSLFFESSFGRRFTNKVKQTYRTINVHCWAYAIETSSELLASVLQHPKVEPLIVNAISKAIDLWISKNSSDIKSSARELPVKARGNLKVALNMIDEDSFSSPSKQKRMMKKVKRIGTKFGRGNQSEDANQPKEQEEEASQSKLRVTQSNDKEVQGGSIKKIERIGAEYDRSGSSPADEDANQPKEQAEDAGQPEIQMTQPNDEKVQDESKLENSKEVIGTEFGDSQAEDANQAGDAGQSEEQTRRKRMLKRIERIGTRFSRGQSDSEDASQSQKQVEESSQSEVQVTQLDEKKLQGRMLGKIEGIGAKSDRSNSSQAEEQAEVAGQPEIQTTQLNDEKVQDESKLEDSEEVLGTEFNDGQAEDANQAGDADQSEVGTPQLDDKKVQREGGIRKLAVRRTLLDDKEIQQEGGLKT